MSIRNVLTKFSYLYPITRSSLFLEVKPEKIQQEIGIGWDIVADYIPDAIFLIDEKGKIIQANKATKDWTAQRAEQIKNCNLHEVVHPHCMDQECYLKKLCSSYRKDLKTEKFIRLKKEDQQLKKHLVISIYQADICLVQGFNRVSAIFVLHDLTQQIEMEKNLLKLYKHLGVLNRQIDILSEIEKEKKISGKNEIIKNIMLSSLELSRAKTTLLFGLEKEKTGNFELLAEEDQEEKDSISIEKIISSSKLALALKEKKEELFGSCEEFFGKFGEKNINSKSKFFLAMPLLEGDAVEGIIIFFYVQQRDFSNQELFFYRLFSSELHSILKNIKLFNNKK